MTEASRTILTNLPTYTDDELRILMGRLTLNMYGADTSSECADYVIAERKRREALAA
jgi:hypothetical protein